MEKISSEKSEDETVSVVPTSTTNTRNTKKIIIFALIGFIASCGVCLVLDLFNENVKEFIDTIADMGFTYWQVLPFNPLDEANSPYCSPSAFAGNYLFINPKGLLTNSW